MSIDDLVPAGMNDPFAGLLRLTPENAAYLLGCLSGELGGFLLPSAQNQRYLRERQTWLHDAAALLKPVKAPAEPEGVDA